MICSALLSIWPLPLFPEPPPSSPLPCLFLSWFHLFLSASTSKNSLPYSNLHTLAQTPPPPGMPSPLFAPESDPSLELNPSSTCLRCAAPPQPGEATPLWSSPAPDSRPPFLQNERPGLEQSGQTHSPKAKSGLYICRFAPTFKNQSRFKAFSRKTGSPGLLAW